MRYVASSQYILAIIIFSVFLRQPQVAESKASFGNKISCPKDPCMVYYLPLFTYTFTLNKNQACMYIGKYTLRPMDPSWDGNSNDPNKNFPPDVFPRVCFHYFSWTHLEWVHLFLWYLQCFFWSMYCFGV